MLNRIENNYAQNATGSDSSVRQNANARNNTRRCRQRVVGTERLKRAHFSDRGRLFQADRGRRFSAIVDAQGMRASEGLNVSQVDVDDADLSTAEGGACDEPTAAVGKSCWH